MTLPNRGLSYRDGVVMAACVFVIACSRELIQYKKLPFSSIYEFMLTMIIHYFGLGFFAGACAILVEYVERRFYGFSDDTIIPAYRLMPIIMITVAFLLLCIAMLRGAIPPNLEYD